MRQVYRREDTYVVSWFKDGRLYEERFDNILDAVRRAGDISELYDTVTRVDIEMGELVRIED